MSALTPFCGVDDPRKYLNAPFSLDGNLLASDGRVLVSLDGAGGSDVPEIKAELLEGMRGFLTNARRASPDVPVESITWGDRKCESCSGSGKCSKIECPDCDGDGVFEHGYHDYDCKNCDGEGVITGPSKDGHACEVCDGTGEHRYNASSIGEGNFSVAASLIRKLQTLPNCRITAKPEGFQFPFHFDGGVGVVMALREPPHKPSAQP